MRVRVPPPAPFEIIVAEREFPARSHNPTSLTLVVVAHVNGDLIARHTRIYPARVDRQMSRTERIIELHFPFRPVPLLRSRPAGGVPTPPW